VPADGSLGPHGGMITKRFDLLERAKAGSLHSGQRERVSGSMSLLPFGSPLGLCSFKVEHDDCVGAGRDAVAPKTEIAGLAHGGKVGVVV